MKKLTGSLLFMVLINCSNAQSLKKYAIGNSGCSVYTFCNPVFEETYSEDSSKIFTGECEKDTVYYGVICVKLQTATSNLDVAEELVVSYLDFLKKNFEIASAAGYGKGNRLNSNENTRGVIDYWQDKKKNNWKVKGWTDGKFIGIVYVYTQLEVPESKANVFLNSFRFPGM